MAKAFHCWLVREDIQLTLVAADAEDVWWFISVLGRPPHERSATLKEAEQRWRAFLPYLDWLGAHGLITFSPESLHSPPPPPPNADPYSGSLADLPFCSMGTSAPGHPSFVAGLPESASRFVLMLKATRKTSTVQGYVTTLRRLHEFLHPRNISLANVARRDIEAWCQRLHADRLHPSTRLTTLLQVRAYFRWAHDEGLLTPEPDDLVRRSDFPKLPQYLPRPLPLNVDRALQARLASGGQLALGLLLMRHTGLRIGELIGLEHNCLRIDPRGRRYLKVPLGKLATERLVPLDEASAALVDRLRAMGRRPRPFLLSTGTKITRYASYRRVLGEASQGLEDADTITTHRLRHTYATSLMAGGMNLPALMRILGHRDYRMTLRYAAISDELVLKEFTQAMAKLGDRYLPHPTSAKLQTSDEPATILSDVERWVASQSLPSSLRDRLLKRIRRLIQDVRRIRG